MSDPNARKHGTCLCGSVAVTAEPVPSMQACHCSMCRTWGGGPFLSIPCKSASFDGPVSRFASSDAADRGFCPTCGTHLFFHVKKADIYAVPAGLFDDSSDIPLRAQIYVEEKPDAYSFAEDTKNLTGAEFEAKFG